jgi:hypothetical protein
MASSDSTRDGGPAFPHTRVHADTSGRINDGLSIRDYFAAQAIIGLLASTAGANPYAIPGPNGFAELAFELADEMLKAREASNV